MSRQVAQDLTNIKKEVYKEIPKNNPQGRVISLNQLKEAFPDVQEKVLMEIINEFIKKKLVIFFKRELRHGYQQEDLVNTLRHMIPKGNPKDTLKDIDGVTLSFLEKELPFGRKEIKEGLDALKDTGKISCGNYNNEEKYWK